MDEIMAGDDSYTDFWQLQFNERYEVMSRRFDDLTAKASEAFGELELMIGGWAKSSADAIAEFADNGKFSFRDMIQSMLKDLISLMAYQTITKPLFGAVSVPSAAAGIRVPVRCIEHKRSRIPRRRYRRVRRLFLAQRQPVSFGRAPRLHGGLMPDEYPAILQKGEAVIPKDKVGGGGGELQYYHQCHRYQDPLNEYVRETRRRSSRRSTATCAVAVSCAGRSRGRCNGIRTHVHRQRWIHKTKVLTAITAIREKCLECSNWSFSEVSTCSIEDCALWPFRMGRYPAQNTKGR